MQRWSRRFRDRGSDAKLPTKTMSGCRCAGSKRNEMSCVRIDYSIVLRYVYGLDIKPYANYTITSCLHLLSFCWFCTQHGSAHTPCTHSTSTVYVGIKERGIRRDLSVARTLRSDRVWCDVRGGARPQVKASTRHASS